MNDQRSLTDQLITLAALADKNGLYDAADFVRQHVATAPARQEQPDPLFWSDEEVAELRATGKIEVD